jgi:ketopantoate reductase
MKKSILVLGMGELGSVFARGFLKLGHPVQGITRDMDLEKVAQQYPNPEAVLIAVGEADIQTTLKNIPTTWKDDLILLQNELLPKDWLEQGIQAPTVISVWFEKKKGMDSKVVLPSPIFGKHSKLVFNALAKLDLPSYQVDSAQELEYELVRKNLYILTTNIAGLMTGGTVSQLASDHNDTMQAVANDVLKLQSKLTQKPLDEPRLISGMLEAFEGDPDHGCMGRSAPVRLARALQIADSYNLELTTLKEIQQKS